MFLMGNGMDIIGVFFLVEIDGDTSGWYPP